VSHLRDVRRHLRASHEAHRKTEEDALREAAVARAQLEATIRLQDSSMSASGEDSDAGPV
jgi:hypothetical protein